MNHQSCDMSVGVDYVLHYSGKRKVQKINYSLKIGLQDSRCSCNVKPYNYELAFYKLLCTSLDRKQGKCLQKLVSLGWMSLRYQLLVSTRTALLEYLDIVSHYCNNGIIHNILLFANKPEATY